MPKLLELTQLTTIDFFLRVVFHNQSQFHKTYKFN